MRLWEVRFLVFFTLFSVILKAQTSTGSIRGVVTDPSGTVASGVTLKLRNLDTNVIRESTTNDSGYEFAYVVPGRYELRASKAGFREAVVNEIRVQVNQAVRLDVGLEIGQVEQVMTVAAEAGLLQTDNPVIGGQLDRKTVVELPGRSLLALFGLSGGVAQLNLTGFVANGLSPLQPSRGGVGANFNFGGYRQTGNYYILDGVSNTNWNINSMILFPAVESVEELRVQVSSNTAAFGLVPGGTVNLVTRAGTNQYHGEAYNYLRNDALDARPYNFNPGRLPKPPLRQNQYGFNLGGPVWIPRLLRGRDRLFFFGHYQGLIQRSTGQVTSSVPTTAVRDGDLSGYGRLLYDPATLNAAGTERLPFPGNVIPRARVDEVSRRWLALMPAPNQPGTVNNFVGARRATADNHQGNFRVDAQLSQRDFLQGSYHFTDETSATESNFGPLTGLRIGVNAHLASLHWTRTVKPNLLNSVKIGFNRLRAADSVFNEGRRDIVGELGIEGISRDPINWGFPNLNTGFVSIVNDAPNRPTNQRDNVYQLLDDATWILGRHSFTLGGEFRRVEFNYRQSNPARGQFRFTGAFTRGANPVQPAGNSGFELADFLLGLPQQATRINGVPQAYLRANYSALYFGDTVRVNRKLTLIAGLRWDYFAPPTELRNNYFNLDFSNLPAAPRLVRVGVDPSPLPSRGIAPNRVNFAPRLGLAYQMLPRTVFRAAYGIYNIQEIGAVYYNLVRNGVRIEVNDSSPVNPQLTFRQAFTRPTFSPTPSYFYIDPQAATPYVQQWSASLQREFPWLMVFEASYTGAKGTKLFRYRSFNTPFQTEIGANLFPRPGNIQQNRTFPQLGPISALETSSSSIYHALQMRLEKRFSTNVSFTNAFTWGKSIDDSDIPVQDIYQNPGAQDERNLRLERGLSFFDIRKRFTSAVILESPWGAGKRYLKRGLLGYLAGPWRVSSILTAQDGYPQNPYNFGSQSTLGTTQRPNVVPGQSLVLTPEERRNLPATPQRPRPQHVYYNPNAFSLPGPYELGNAGRNIMPTPGSLTADLAFYRIFPLPREGHNLSFRADLLNALNIVNFGIPIPTPWAPSFGQFNSANSMRVVILSLKYAF
jgi:hypothetical protein